MIDSWSLEGWPICLVLICLRGGKATLSKMCFLSANGQTNDHSGSQDFVLLKITSYGKRLQHKNTDLYKQ